MFHSKIRKSMAYHFCSLTQTMNISPWISSKSIFEELEAWYVRKDLHRRFYRLINDFNIVDSGTYTFVKSILVRIMSVSKRCFYENSDDLVKENTFKITILELKHLKAMILLLVITYAVLVIKFFAHHANNLRNKKKFLVKTQFPGLPWTIR